MRVARFDARYRLTLPAGEYTITDPAGRSYTIGAGMEWVRPASARVVANAIARLYPSLPFTIEVCRAVGPARFEWKPMWWSPAAESKRHGVWMRLAAAVAAFRGGNP